MIYNCTYVKKKKIKEKKSNACEPYVYEYRMIRTNKKKNRSDSGKAG